MTDKEVFYKDSNYLNISLNALSHNFGFLKSKLQDQTKVIAMVKSNAYGHGLIPISKHLETLHVDYFGVFTVAEAILLRESGIRKDIIIFGPFLERDIHSILTYHLSLVVGSSDEIKILLKYKGKKQIKLHIKVDTGMGRIGFLPEEGLTVIESLYEKYSSLILEGVCTHFSDSSSLNKEYTNYQGNRFIELLNRLQCKQIQIPVIHASNSAGILGYPQFHFNCVRPGIMLYGIDPFINKFDLKPILSLHSYVSSVKYVPENSFISYNRTFQTKSETKIAVIPFGYADGFMLDLSNKACVSIHNRLFPIIGNICMNQFIIDITAGDDVQIYDPVTLIEADNQSKIGLINLSKLSQKIPYEILCRLSESIFRKYA